MDIHQKRLQLGLEVNVVIAASEPPSLTELRKGDPACGTRFLVDFGKLLDRFVHFKLLCQHPSQRRDGARFIALRQVGSRVVLTKMEAGRSTGLRQLGNVESGWFFAMLTFHRLISHLA